MRNASLRVLAPAGVIALAAVIVLAVAVGPLSRGGDGGIAEAQAFLEALPERLDVEDGQVIYMRTERYLRFGSRAAQIRAVADIATEERSHEAWMEVGEDGTAARTVTRTFDGHGTLVHETTNQAAGETPRSVASYDIRVLQETARIKGYLDSGDARVLRHTAGEVTIEASAPFPDSIRERELGAEQFRLPFYDDLDLERAVFIWTLDKRGLLVDTKFFAETAGGERVLIESQRVAEFEILDEMPAEIAAAF